MEVSIPQAYEEGFVSAYTKCHCIGIVASCDVIFGLCFVYVFNRVREMINEDNIARAFGEKADKIHKAFEESEEQIIEHQKRLEEINEQIRSQQAGSRKHIQ